MKRPNDSNLKNAAEDVLRHSEAGFRVLFEQAGWAVLIHGIDGRIIDANRCACEQLGYSRDELLGMDVFGIDPDALQGEDHERFWIDHRQGSLVIDRRHRRKDGSIYPASITLKRFVFDGQSVICALLLDLTEQKIAEAELAEREESYRLLVNNARDMIYRMSLPDGRYVFVSPAAEAILGYSPVEIMARPLLIQDIIHPECSDYFVREWARLLKGEIKPEYEYRIITKTGQQKWLHQRNVLVRDTGGKPAALEAVVSDITNLKMSEQALRQSEERYTALFAHISNGVFVYDVLGDGEDFVLRDLNPAAEEIEGGTRDDLIGRSACECHPGGAVLGLIDALRRVWRTGIAEQISATRYQSARGNRWCETSVYRLPTGQVVSVLQDITEVKQRESRLLELAHTDVLTGLPNRTLLADRLQQAMAQVRRRDRYVAVAYFDLDGFKPINDNYGHAVGDKLLVALARRLKATLRDGETLARIGGDEFVLVLVDLSDRESSTPFLTRLFAAAREPLRIEGVEHRVTISLGATFYPQADEIDADQLLRQADQAMYQAKLAGKNCYRLFNVNIENSARDRWQQVERIRQALAQNEFELHYQPKINMRSGAVLGVEALIRWKHPERGRLPPGEFLPIIEDDQLAVDLGEWVLDTALTQLDAWRAEGIDLPVSVNIGAHQLQQAGFAGRLTGLLAAHPAVDPSSLGLEVREGTALDDLSAVSQTIAECRALGVQVALDDLGAGFPSMTVMKQLPADLLKIDQSVVRDMPQDPDNLATIDAVLSVAVAFRRETIAEGVETLGQGEMLLLLGCELAQGYCIAPPMPAQDLPTWLATWRPYPIWVDVAPLDRTHRPLLYARVELQSWMRAMRQYLEGSRSTPPALDLDESRLSEWLKTGGLTDHPRHEEQLTGLHRELYELGQHLSQLYADGRGSEALAKLDDLDSLSEMLLKLMQQLIRR